MRRCVRCIRTCFPELRDACYVDAVDGFLQNAHGEVAQLYILTAFVPHECVRSGHFRNSRTLTDISVENQVGHRRRTGRTVTSGQRSGTRDLGVDGVQGQNGVDHRRQRRVVDPNRGGYDPPLGNHRLAVEQGPYAVLLQL